MDPWIFKPWIKWCYPHFEHLYEGDEYYYQLFRRYFFMQKILRINGSVPWPVDFRSMVIDWKKIQKAPTTYPGGSPGCYINASGGLIIGEQVTIGPNVVIATVNHSHHDYRKTASKKGVKIGNRVWIGANCSIVPGANIGDDVTIGAGCYIRSEIPANSIVKQSDEQLIIIPKKSKENDEKGN